jgi:hypothetical protein
LLVLNVSLCIYSGVSLSLIFTVRDLIRNISDDWLIEGGNNFLIGTEDRSLANYFSVLALHGVFPVSIS